MSAPQLYNRTRQSSSIADKLRRERRWLEIPLYHLLRQSDLAREGLENSGSYRFADHIYRNRPSGDGPLGTALDRVLLKLPAVRSFRNRYLAARDELVTFLLDRPASTEPIHVLSAPCGLPRELVEAGSLANARSPGCLDRVTFHGLDLDQKVLADAVEYAEKNGLPRFQVHRGDALDPKSYPVTFDYITCTGLAEFLDDVLLARLYRTFHHVLKPGGVLFTSGMRRLALSDYLLELAELHTHYRTSRDLGQLAELGGFATPRISMDRLGIQSFLLARR